MTKAESKKERRNAIAAAHSKIFRNIAAYLTGSKWNGAKFQIGDLKTKSSAFGIIKMVGGYLGGKCFIYYVYFECKDDFSNIPSDMDDYVYQTQTFFKELLRHILYLNGDDFGCTSTASYQECVSKPEPPGFCVNFGLTEPAEYNYT